MQKVIDSKIIVRSIIAGDQYGNPMVLLVTGPTLEAYLHDLYADGWSLFSTDVLGQGNVQGTATIEVLFVLVQYEKNVGAGSEVEKS